MTTGAELFNNDVHFSDTQKVRDAARDDIASKLLTFNATPDEAIDWYYSNDPLSLDLNTLNALYTGGDSGVDGANLKTILTEISTVPSRYEHAGITLLLDIVNKDLLEDVKIDGGTDKIREFVKGYPATPGNEIIVVPLLARLPHNMSPEQLEKAFIALDCFQNAGKGYLRVTGEFGEILRDLSSSYDVSVFEAKASLYPEAALNLATRIHIAANSGVNKKDKRAYKIGFQAAQFHFSSLLETINLTSISNVNNIPESDTLKQQTTTFVFDSFAASIKHYFLNNPSFPDRKVIKGEEKGLLHEALWLLDINFLLSQDPDLHFSYAVPTFPRNDCPRIGRPTLRRAYDIHVRIGDTLRTIPVQLKSSIRAGESGNDYHPNIEVVSEDNFQEVDVRRLSVKLEKYKQWIAGGCKEEDAADVRAYLLPSAVEFLDRIHEINTMDHGEYMLSKLSTTGLDRAARRRLKRVIRKNS